MTPADSLALVQFGVQLVGTAWVSWWLLCGTHEKKSPRPAPLPVAKVVRR